MTRLVLATLLGIGVLGSGCKKSGCERLAQMTRECFGTRMPEPKIMRGQLDAEQAGACDAAVEHGDEGITAAVACAEAADDCDAFVECLSR